MISRNLIIGGAAVIVVLAIVLGYVFWPAPGPSPAEDALRQQNEALIKQNEQLAKDAAARTAEAQQLREDADAKLEEIVPIRNRRRAARADGSRRRDAIAATPDGELAATLRVQHARARAALELVRAEAGSTAPVVGQPVPR